MLSAFLAASRRATRLLLSRKSQGNKTGPSSRYWDQFFGVTAQQADANRAEWQAHPVVAAYQDRQRGGRSLEQWFVDEVLRGAKVKHGLGIGSGAAPFEVGLVKAGVIEHLDVVDPSLKGGAFAVPDPAQVAEADPTEAVRSSEIESCFRRAFPDATVVPRNGGLLFTLWWSLNHDALFDTQEGIQFVRELCERDESLTQNGALPSYFADLWARTVE